MIQDFHEIFSLLDRNIPVSVMLFDRKSGSLFESHWHEKFEILVVCEGNMQVICDGCVINARKGDIVFINPCQLHSGVVGDLGVVYYCIIMEPNFLVSINMDVCDKTLLEIQNSRIRISNLIKDDEMYRLLMGVTSQNKEKQPYYEMYIRSYLMLFMSQAVKKHRMESTPRAGTMVSRITSYITEHYAESLSTKALSEQFGFSLSYFCRYFKKETGEKVVDYINAVRLNKACALLQQTELPVTEIALLAGYTSINYFNHRFRAKLGCSPLQFRKAKSTDMQLLLED